MTPLPGRSRSLVRSLPLFRLRALFVTAALANNLLAAAIQARDGATGTVTGNYTQASPVLFVNASAGDLHLKSTAAVAIHQAGALSSCPTDWDGQSRPRSGANDIGADEYQSTSPPSAPTNLRIR